ncbi:hypothetical protein GCM10010269_58500 [Streptomyces humidus]|uniref:Uncharacterized protein n=1 Tax=Streptomyces humidus TaxID=52259 RepID=A0A918L6J2_9ACTN|nr:hypothetical protein GCM10010269_58500 [Streptomyces humidus]
MTSAEALVGRVPERRLARARPAATRVRADIEDIEDTGQQKTGQQKCRNSTGAGERKTGTAEDRAAEEG